MVERIWAGIRCSICASMFVIMSCTFIAASMSLVAATTAGSADGTGAAARPKAGAQLRMKAEAMAASGFLMMILWMDGSWASLLASWQR
jgi:hypothetical protein